MTYLIVEIVLYLLAALLLGLAAGWLLRGVRTEAPATARTASAALPGVAAIESPGVRISRDAHQAEVAADRARIRELEALLATQRQDAAGLARKLEAAAGRVRELEGERALQHRAIEVLHQQLELANEWRGTRTSKVTGTNG